MLAILSLGLVPSAHATQSLDVFLEGGRRQSFDAREQTATTEQRSWEKDAALGRLLPSLSARGVYQYNQYEVAVQLPGLAESITIQPHHQLDAFFQLDVPLIDLANYHRYRQSKHMADAAGLQNELVGTDVDRIVAQAYYTFLGASALADSARQSLSMAEENVAFVQNRVDVGVALELDLERAKANLERSKQDVTDAELARSLAARHLETWSGISPEAAKNYPEDDLHPEGNLDFWLKEKDSPADRVQEKMNEAAVSGKRAAAFSLLPTLSANAQERLTNATGFVGRSNYYTLQAVLSWKLDYATYANAQAQAAASEVQKVRAERTQRNIDDSLFEAYQKVEAGIAKSASARAQARAAQKAADLAMERYQAGALTQLDVTQSQREAFQADAARIKADADLAYARVSLRVIAGKRHDFPSPKARSQESSSPAVRP